MASNNKKKKSASKSSSGAGSTSKGDSRDKMGRIMAIILIAAMIGFTFITAGLFLLD